MTSAVGRESPSGPFRDPAFPRDTVRLNANATIIAGAAAANIFAGNVAGSRQIQVCTEDLQESICVWFFGVRNNANAAGTGQYEVFIDNVAAGQDFVINAGTIGILINAGPLTFTIGLPGLHAVDIRCIAAVGNETVVTNFQMVIEALSFGPRI